MDKIKPLFYGVVSVNLSVPKEMGMPGKPGIATPEHLFAAGYAACFGGALDYVARKKNAANARVMSAVSIGPRDCPYSHAMRGNVDVSFEVIGS